MLIEIEKSDIIKISGFWIVSVYFDMLSDSVFVHRA